MDNNKTLLEWLQRPIIAVVRHSGELDAALLSPCSIIELRASSLIDLPQIVQRCRQARKALFIYPELSSDNQMDPQIDIKMTLL